MKKIATYLLLASCISNYSRAQFSPGNVIVSRVGDGTSSLTTGNTAAVSLLEFNTTATATTLALTSQTPITTTALTGGSGNQLTFSGNVIAEGLLNRSMDGRYLMLLGYNLPAGASATNYCVAGVSATDNGIMKITITNGGSGYTSAPTVVFTGGGGTAAAATAVITGGVVSYIYVRASGSAYTGTPVISFTGGGGTGAAATVDADRTSKGTGYTSTGLTVVFSNPDIAGAAATGGAQQTGGAISNIYISTNGAGYTTQPTVTINHPTGTGAKQCVYINPTFPYWQGSNVSKVIGRVDFNGAVDYSTTISNLTTSNGAPAPAKMVASSDGSAFWAANNVITYAPFGATAGVQVANSNTTGIHIFKDQLISAVAFGNISSYNTPPAPLPVAAATASNLITQSGTFYGYQSIVLFDLDPNVSWSGTGYDVMYLADRTYGLAKYYFNGTAWTVLNYSNAAALSPTPCIFPSGGLTTITGALNNLGQPVIYGIIGTTSVGNSSGLASLTDKASYNTSMVAASTDVAYIAKADANYGFRGVALAPLQFSLPVSLATFTGSLIGGKTLVNWTTLLETNAKEFIIERSTNGTDFSPLGTVASKNRNLPTSYSFEDGNPAKGINYYRLKLVDKDDHFKYSQVVLIRVDGSAGIGLKLFPNPVVNNILISHPKAEGAAQISILGVDGKLISSLNVAENAVQTSLDITSLQAGQYWIRYVNKGKTMAVSFVK